MVGHNLSRYMGKGIYNITVNIGRLDVIWFMSLQAVPRRATERFWSRWNALVSTTVCVGLSLSEGFGQWLTVGQGTYACAKSLFLICWYVHFSRITIFSQLNIGSLVFHGAPKAPNLIIKPPTLKCLGLAKICQPGTTAATPQPNWNEAKTSSVADSIMRNSLQVYKDKGSTSTWGIQSICNSSVPVDLIARYDTGVCRASKTIYSSNIMIIFVLFCERR